MTEKINKDCKMHYGSSHCTCYTNFLCNNIMFTQVSKNVKVSARAAVLEANHLARAVLAIALASTDQLLPSRLIL